MVDIRKQGTVAPPAGVNDGGHGAAASAFAGAANGAARLGAKLRQIDEEAGKQEAIRDAQGVAGEASLSLPKREKSFMDLLRVNDEAYENVSEVLAIQRAEGAAKDKLRDLELEHGLDPKMFSDKAESWMRGYLGGDIPPDLAKTVEASVRGEMKNGLHRIAKARQKKDVQEAENGINARIETISEEMDAFLRTNGLQGANDPAFVKLQDDLRSQYEIKALNPAFAYSEAEMERDLGKVADSLNKSAAFKAVTDIYEAGGGNEASKQQAYEGIETIIDGFDLTTADAQSMRTALRKEVNAKHDLNEAGIARQDKEEKLRRDWAASHLKIGISRGEFGAADIEKHKADLSPAKYAELTIQNDKAVKKRIDDAKAASFTEGLISGRTVANPFDPKHVKAMSSYYDNTIAPQLAQSDNPEGVAVDFIKATNILPKGLENGLVGQLMNGDVLGQVRSVGIMSAIARETPVAYDQFPSKARRIASHANQLMIAGQIPENSIIRAREAQFVDDPIRNARKSQLSKNVMAKAVDRGIKELKVDGMSDNLAARSDYALLYEAEFLATGDEDAAHHIAKQRITTVWGGTDVFGEDKSMRYPPEKLYAVAGMSEKQNAAWIKEEFHKVLNGEDAEAFRFEGYTPLRKRSELVSDNQTARGDGSYAIWYETPDGFGGTAHRPLMRDGVPVRFKPEWDSSTEAGRRKAAEKKDLDRNRALHRNKVYGEPLPVGFYDENLRNLGKNTL